MDFKSYADTILQEINKSVLSIDTTDIDSLVNIIVNAKRIYCDGMGKSGLQVDSFAMRLTQMGIKSYVVSGITTPAITSDDLLIICSGSGETPTLKEHVKTAKAIGAKIVIITTNRESSIGKLGDYIINISAPIKNSKTCESIQPMGSLFEQSIGIFFDVLVLMLMEKKSISSEDMYKNHKNLE